MKESGPPEKSLWRTEQHFNIFIYKAPIKMTHSVKKQYAYDSKLTKI